MNKTTLIKAIAEKTGKVPQLGREVTEPVEVSHSTIRKILQMRNVRLYVWIYLTSFSYVIIKK